MQTEGKDGQLKLCLDVPEAEQEGGEEKEPFGERPRPDQTQVNAAQLEKARLEGEAFRLEELNQEQLQAVTSTEGFVRVIAGAGSGKTRALTHRFAFLVNEMGILPENILCVTFTNKAAGEMRRRIRSLIGDQDTGYINTFHGFCVSVLQEDIYALAYPNSFLVLDNSDIDSMLRIIYEERGLTLRDKTFGNARDMIEMQKLVHKPDYYLDVLDMSLEKLHEKYLQAVGTDEIIFYGYLYQEKKCFGLDYNDLIKFTLYLFEKNADIRLKWQERLEYIMIDEFQDIDKLQYQLMEVLCDFHKNLFIVGDPDQTIYTWRGADVSFLLDFDKEFAGTQTILLVKNYRSRPEILRAANSLIDKNQSRVKKELIPTRERGESVPFFYGKSQEEEAKWILSQIKLLTQQGVSLGDITLLYRAHHVTRPIEEELIREKLPYRIYSGVPFFGRAEVKDALSYLRMVLIQDDLSFRRIVNLPKRNLGNRRMAFLEEYSQREGLSLYESLKKTLEDPIFSGTGAGEFVRLVEGFTAGYEGRPVSELLNSLLNESGYEEMLRTEGSQERLDNLAELLQSVHEYETSCGEEATPAHYLAHVALFTNADTGEEKEKLKLMTVHAAKGLEFPYVFLLGMNEGISPSRKTKDKKGMEEERRLAFVAMTRARERLYLSGAMGKNYDGSDRYPSRFVLDIDEGLLDFVQKPEEGILRTARAYIAHSERFLPEEVSGAFPVGSRVRHAYMGLGTIQEVRMDKSAYVIQFDSLGTTRLISFRVKLVREE